MTLPEPIVRLIREEQERQEQRFIESVDLEAYLLKLGTSAEILANLAEGRCRALVAFYCNNTVTRQAYITLVVVDPRDRALGMGRALVTGALDLARSRGFTSCRLEVATGNAPAQALYRSLGFRPVEQRQGRDVLELQL